MTLPRLPRTLPKRTLTKRQPGAASEAALVTRCSPMRLVTPSTLTGFTALSVETFTTIRVAAARAASSTFRVPKMLFPMASSGFCSR